MKNFEAGLDKNNLYVTYILKRRPLRKYNKEKTREICMQHLMEQLEIHKPELLVCLGNVTVQSFFQNPELDVKGLRGTWHQFHGFQTTVAYHPLAARRRPNLYPLLLEDFKFVAGEFLNKEIDIKRRITYSSEYLSYLVVMHIAQSA